MVDFDPSSSTSSSTISKTFGFQNLILKCLIPLESERAAEARRAVVASFCNSRFHLFFKVVLPAAGTIADVVANDPELRTLNKILSKSGVMEELEEAEGHFTLFAPTDAAFEKIDKSLIEKLIRGDGCG